MDSSQYWSSMAFVRNVLMAVVRKGGDLEELCHELEMTPEVLEQTHGKASIKQCMKVWEIAVREMEDPFLGLHMGELSSPGLAGMVGYLAESSPDMMTAYQNVQQFNQILTNATQFSFEIHGEEFYYYIEPVNTWYMLSVHTARQVVEHSMSTSVHISKMLTGKAIYPNKVMLRFDRPKETQEYLRIFKCEPLFSQDCNCIVYRLRDMKLPVIGHNPSLNRLFKELLEKEIVKTQQQESFAGEVKRAILQNFDNALPQLSDIVQYLHVSPRTLQRKLQDESTSFQQIFESVKLELATGMLKNPSLTVNEIAYKLGYAEPSVFRRAFKKWTGTSPKAYIVQ
ncbi:MAG: AraC family transcriptional regulator [Saprospiraceae bacterium]|nr:AraC family transcriptional regulator [Saprospiraceae bacterium]